MIEQKEMIGEDGTVEGAMIKGEMTIGYRVEGKAIESGRLVGLDIMAEVRAAVTKELDSYIVLPALSPQQADYE